jgi:hypothetical protein
MHRSERGLFSVWVNNLDSRSGAGSGRSDRPPPAEQPPNERTRSWTAKDERKKPETNLTGEVKVEGTTCAD